MEEAKQMEQFLWEFYLKVDDGLSCNSWEKECLKCLEWLEEQYRLKMLQQGHGIQSLVSRIARLEGLRHSLRKRYKSVDVRIPALSTNIPINSIVQMVQGREIGLKKSHTRSLYYCLKDHYEVMSMEWDWEM